MILPWYPRWNNKGPLPNWVPVHRNTQLVSSVRHCVSPNCIPLSFRCPLPPHPTFYCHPRRSGSALQAQSLIGSKGLAQQSHLHPCPGLLQSAEPCSQTSLCCQNGATCFQALLQNNVSETHPHLSTFASISLVQGLSPNSSPFQAPLSNLMETTATCNLFQGWSVHSCPLFKCPQ